MLEVLKRQPKQVLLTALLRLPEQAPGYIVGTFIFTYGTTVLGMTLDFLLWGVLAQTALGFMWVTIAGRLSDVVGRKRMETSACVIMAIFGFVYYALLDTRIPWVIFVAVAISLIPVMNLYGPEAALIAELFSPRLRYSGASLGYQLASIFAGGPAPVAATRVAKYHSSLPVAIYILAVSIIGLIATSLLRDHTNRDISAVYENV